MIKTKNLTKDYGGGRGILDLDLSIPSQTVFGFIGPNGSGKTTTIKLLCGLTRPDSGRAWIGDLEVLPRNHVKIKKTIGFLPDEFGVYEQMSVWEYLDFFGATYRIPPKPRRKRIEEVLDVTDASHMIDYQVSSLSRGMHQKIGIAKTLLHDPQLLILDEPANGLDPYARIEMRETILRLKEMGKTLMVSSHILPELGSVCDQVGIIEKGALLKQGTLDEIISSMQQNIVLELNVISDAETAAACALELPTVNDVTFSGNDMRLDFVGSRDQIADLNDHLVENGVRLIALREAEVDLEQVFLSVTGKDDKRDMGTASKPGPDATRQQSQPGQTQRNPAVSKNQGINAAMQQARDNVQEFIKVLCAPEEDEHDFAVKKLFRRDGEEDLLWVVDLDFDGTVFNGVLRNGSKKFPDLAKGTEVAVDVRELADWMYVEGDLLIGGYTIRLIYSRLPEDKKEAFLRKKPYSVIE